MWGRGARARAAARDAPPRTPQGNPFIPGDSSCKKKPARAGKERRGGPPCRGGGGMLDAWLRRLAPAGAGGARVQVRDLLAAPGGRARRAMLVVCTRRPG